MNDETKKILEWCAYGVLAAILFIVTAVVCTGIWEFCPYVLTKVAAVLQLGLNVFVMYKLVKKIMSIK